jgi:protein O-mannosyl-transferase
MLAKKPEIKFTGRELLFIGMAVATLAYTRTFLYPFAFDDHNQIVANARIQSWHYLPQYFTSHIWAQLYGNQSGTVLFRSYYRPLFLIWLRLNYVLFGSSPVGWHLTTVAAHIGVACLVYVFAGKLLRDMRAAAIAAAVFALLPIQIESVAWISGVTEPLTGLFIVGGYVAFLQAWEGGKRAKLWYALSLAAYGLALLSKEGAAIFPATIFAYAYLYGRREEPDAAPLQRLWYAVRQSIAYAPVLGAYLLARAFALKGLLNVSAPMTVSEMVYTYPSAIWFYVKHLLLPTNLALLYSVPEVRHPWFLTFWLPLGAFLAACAVAWRFARSSKLVAFCFGLIVIHLLIPLVAFNFFGEADRVHDRYLYISSVGFAILVAAAWKRAPEYCWKGISLRSASIVLLLVLYTGAVISQERQWSSDRALFERAVQVSPDSTYAHHVMAILFVNEGQYDEAQKQIDILRKMRPDPSYCGVLIPSGYLHEKTGNYSLADKELSSCIRQPGDLLFLGEIRLKMNQPERAVEAFRRAVELLPEDINGRLRYASALHSSGDVAGAIQQYKIVLAALPGEDGLRAHIATLEKQVSK